jgi:hypothetical protein
VRTAITLWMIAEANALLLTAGSAPAADAPAAASAWKSPAQAGRPAPKTRPAGDKAIIHTVADALGFVRGVDRSETTNTLNRLQWGGSGKMTDGTVVSSISHYRYTLSLHLKAAREDYERVSRGKAQHVVQVVAGEDAWDEQQPGVGGHMNPGSARARQLQLARTPFGFARWLLEADPSTVKVIDDGPNKISISLPIDGVVTTAVLDPDYRPASISMKVDGRQIVDRYRDYRDLAEYGVMFPTKIGETVDGRPHLELSIDDARVASYAVFPKP